VQTPSGSSRSTDVTFTETHGDSRGRHAAVAVVQGPDNGGLTGMFAVASKMPKGSRSSPSPLSPCNLWAMPTEPLPITMCPGCKTQMRVKAVEPISLSPGLEDILYQCPQCRTETRRAIKPATNSFRARVSLDR
jgi:hypothetical protein